jgi:hypothetical protein
MTDTHNAAMQWQPIETAPKGGWILGFGDGPSTLLCAYLMEWDGEGWAEIYSDALMAPTHWMPLPPPPTV